MSKGNGHNTGDATIWPKIDEACALYGLAGDVVRTIAPHSEADPVAILVQFLAVAGNIFGRNCFYLVESDRHYPNLFAVLVGQSSKARKGTSMGRVCAIAKVADQQWFEDRRRDGLSSGEGFINEVRDEAVKWNTKKKRWEQLDPGVTDKRLMVTEPEFAGALAVMERHGNTLSAVLRKAWDGGKLQVVTRNSPIKATGAHVSVIGHITEAELQRRLTETDAANGFANRFMFALVKRSQFLPFGGDLSGSDLADLGCRLSEIAAKLPHDHRMTLTPDAKEEWRAVYSKLSAGRPGLLGAITARAEAQVVRLALVYTLLDGEQQIDLPHLQAGLAVWDYCQRSAEMIFGDATGDPVADEVTRALRVAGEDGLTRTAIRDLFGRHQGAKRLQAALTGLLMKGRARSETRNTGGRPMEIWFAT